MNKKRNKGFTLTEMIVVIAIIGILAGVLIPTITGYIKKAHLSNDGQIAASMTDEIERYCIENNLDQKKLTGLDIRTILIYKDFNLNPESNNYAFLYNYAERIVELVKVDDIQIASSLTANDDITEVSEGYYLISKGESELETAVSELALGNYEAFTSLLTSAKYEDYKEFVTTNYNPDTTLYLNYIGVVNSNLSTSENQYTKVVFCEKTNYLIKYYFDLNIIANNPKLLNSDFRFIAAGSEDLAEKLGIKKTNIIALNSVGSSIECTYSDTDITAEKLDAKLNLTEDSSFEEVKNAGFYFTAEQIQKLSYKLGENVNSSSQIISSVSAVDYEKGIWKLSVIFMGDEGLIGYKEIYFTRF
jgi:prepilin-type N-terminal cleavage/methylation domain-containing protein